MTIIEKENIKKIFKFIGDTHKQINNNYNEVVELRALRRDKKSVRPLRSFIYYNYDEKELEHLTKQIEELNGLNIPYCFYYSVYSYDSSKGKLINTNSAMSTSILVSDYDHINEDDFKKVLDKLKKIDLEPNYVIFTGHGYQTVYILKEPCYDKDLLSKYTNLLIKKGLPVDSTIKDIARIMRLPYTWNSKDPANPIATYIYSEKEGVYNLDNIFNTLENQLETIPGYKENIKDKETKQVKVESNTDLTYYDNDFLTQTYLYTGLSIDTTPAPIKAILMGLRNGKSDKMIRALVLYLRDRAGLNLIDITKIVNILTSLNTYNYTGDVITDIDRKVKALFYKYEYKFSYKDIKEFGDMGGKVLDRSILNLSNNLIDKEISNIAYVIYLKLLLKQHYDHVISFTMDEIAELCNRSVDRIRPKVNELVKAKLIDKARSDKKNGGQYRYTISKYSIDKTKGYTKINTNSLGSLIEKLDAGIINATVLKFLLFMKSVAYHGDGDGFLIDQNSIAKKLNIKQPAVSILWSKIEKINTEYQKYITREVDGWTLKPGDKFNYIYEVHF